MKKLYQWIVAVILVILLHASCRENPRNTFGGPSNNPQDTAVSSRDTTSAGYRTDGREANN
jgi:hypothetical protein